MISTKANRELEDDALLGELARPLTHEFNNFLNSEVAAFNKTATEHGSSTLFAGVPIQIKAEGGSSTGAGDLLDQDEDQPQSPK